MRCAPSLTETTLAAPHSCMRPYTGGACIRAETRIGQKSQALNTRKICRVKGFRPFQNVLQGRFPGLFARGGAVTPRARRRAWPGGPRMLAGILRLPGLPGPCGCLRCRRHVLRARCRPS